MRSLLLTFSVILSTLPSFAGTMWFDPPNPTDLTPVTAHHMTLWHACVARDVRVERHGTTGTITIRFDCAAEQPFNTEADLPVDIGILTAGVYEVRAVTSDQILLSRDNTLIVRQASPPLRMEPDVVPALQAGERVTIRGAGIVPVCVVAPCPAPVVTFGEQRAEVVETKNTDTVVVVAPAGYVATVDVTVTAAGEPRTAVAAFHYGTDGEPAFFEKIFFPVIVNGPGAFGARWSTEAVMRNENDYPLTAMGDIFALDSRPPAHSTTRAGAWNFANGFLLLVPRQAGPNLSFSVRVKDLSRQPESPGTEIPVIREKDYFRQSFSILDVPLDPRFRVTLRAYRLDRRLGIAVRVRAAPSDETLLEIRPDSGGPIVLDLSGDPRLAGKGPLRIDVEGTWAFVSVTNNETQQVTILPAQ